MPDAIAQRYARALYAVSQAQQVDGPEAVRQLRDFEATFEASRPLREILMNPSIPSPQKLSVLDGLGQHIGMARAVRNFLAVLMDHQRLHELGEMVDEFATVADQGSGLTEVEIVTARGIDGPERQELEQKAADLAGGRVRATYVEDASLLGGAILKIGSTVYDGSLRARLAALKQSMSEARIA